MARTMDDSRAWFQEAAHWWMLLHGEGVTAADRRGFLAWVSRSPERIEAYLEVTRLMAALRSREVPWPDTSIETLVREAKSSIEPMPLTAAQSGSPPAKTPRSAASGARARQGRARRGWRAAAGALVAVAAAVGCWLWLPGGARIYQTRPGEQRSILLADGSRVTLNSASGVEVDLGRKRRILHLLRGEALFQVSHDPARPFDVYARGTVVRAIGTEFNVDLRQHYAAVTVLQGRVAVMSAAQASLPIEPAPLAPPGSGPRLQRFPAPAGSLILGVAQQVRITPRGVGAARPVSDLAATIAWARGQLVFEHRPLGEVVDELYRDGGEHIDIESAALRSRKVTGVIQIDDPSSLLEFLRDVPGVKIHRTNGGTSVVTFSRLRFRGAAHVSNAQH